MEQSGKALNFPHELAAAMGELSRLGLRSYHRDTRSFAIPTVILTGTLDTADTIRRTCRIVERGVAYRNRSRIL